MRPCAWLLAAHRVEWQRFVRRQWRCQTRRFVKFALVARGREHVLGAGAPWQASDRAADAGGRTRTVVENRVYFKVAVSSKGKAAYDYYAGDDEMAVASSGAVARLPD